MRATLLATLCTGALAQGFDTIYVRVCAFAEHLI